MDGIRSLIPDQTMSASRASLLSAILQQAAVRRTRPRGRIEYFLHGTHGGDQGHFERSISGRLERLRFDYRLIQGHHRVPLPPSDKHPMVGLTWGDMLKWCNARSEMEGLPGIC